MTTMFVTLDGEEDEMWDGSVREVPAVGDALDIDGKRFVVVRREWQIPTGAQQYTTYPLRVIVTVRRG